MYGVEMNLISIRDLTKKQIEDILDHADKVKPGKLSGKVLSTAFFEASTRTRLSFQSAAVRLGMQYIDFSPGISSLKKGENFTDTIRMLDGYSDVVVVRHAKEGTARLAAEVADAVVINAGDGGNQHPTQTLLDLYTIKKLKNDMAKLKVALVGDLKHARTMQSLVYALSMFGASIKLISPKGLNMDTALVEEIKKKFDANIATTQQLDFKDSDVLYVCRIQEERFADPYEAKRVKEKFKITMNSLEGVKEDLAILHPLPKIGEIEPAIDKTKYAKYFQQARNGIPVRMGIIDYLLNR